MIAAPTPTTCRLALALITFSCAPALAGTTNWINSSGGVFHDVDNWDAGVPLAPDTAIFDLDTNYDVLFEVDVINDFLIFAEGDVVFDLTDYELGGVVVGENIFDVGRLTLEDGSMLVTGDQLVRIGKNLGADGELVVSLRATFTSQTNVIVGDAGSGTFMVDRGGQAVSVNTFVGDDADSLGSIVVDGIASAWSNTGNLLLGNFGEASMSIVGGGSATTAITFMGDDAGSTGEVTVSGTGSRWTCTGELFAGNSGTGTIDVLAGASAVTTRVKLGDEIDSDGTATVDGAGSTWTDSVELIVGNFGTGLLTISGGGVVSGVLGTIGDDPGSSGTAVVDGANSRWDNTGLVKNGDLGAGTIRIIGGGRVNAGGGYAQSAASALEFVLGPDSTDMLLVTGTATLAGSLDVTLADGYEPAGGTMFVILDSGGIAGAFDSINAQPGLVVTVEPTRVVVEVEDSGEPCPADIDDSGAVDFDDLLAVLAGWGPCGKDCPADIDMNGDVDFNDLLAVLATWGPCP